MNRERNRGGAFSTGIPPLLGLEGETGKVDVLELRLLLEPYLAKIRYEIR